MASVADAFSDDLEQIRKVRHLFRAPFYAFPVAHYAQPEGTEYDQIAPCSADRLSRFWQRGLLVARGRERGNE